MDWRNPVFWDHVAQYMVFTSVIGMFLTARKNKWGFVVGLSGQPFWFLTSLLHGQWGVFILTAFYTCTYIYGIYNWFRKPKTITT